MRRYLTSDNSVYLVSEEDPKGLEKLKSLCIESKKTKLIDITDPNNHIEIELKKKKDASTES